MKYGPHGGKGLEPAYPDLHRGEPEPVHLMPAPRPTKCENILDNPEGGTVLCNRDVPDGERECSDCRKVKVADAVGAARRIYNL